MSQHLWHNSGIDLLEITDDGHLAVTPDYLRALFCRPEMQPVAESCDAELALYDGMIKDPAQAITPAQIAQLADLDVRENYHVLLAYRDLLIQAGTMEAAYLTIIGTPNQTVPGLFLDQLVHAILAHIMTGQADPMRWRAAEILFRDQSVSTNDGRVMLADDEAIEYHQNHATSGQIDLLNVQETMPREVELDVLDDDNKSLYWARAERFDTVLDFRFTQPGNDAFARVLEAWLSHFLGLKARIQPLQQINDDRWLWHIGLDREASRLLNALYHGESLNDAIAENIIALFKLEIADKTRLQIDMQDRPIYLAVAKTAAGKLKLKPQNLLVNLPLLDQS